MMFTVGAADILFYLIWATLLLICTICFCFAMRK